MGVKRVAVIGLGPSGAITIDALAQEHAFDVIRVFERREAAGGCWLEDKNPPPNLLPEDLPALATRTGDATLPSPTKLPARQPKIAQARHAESSVYPYLETNVDSLAMSFSAEPIPSQRSQLSIAKHGFDTPFRSHAVIRGYVESLVRRNGYEGLVSYNTSVELAEKVGEEWRLVLRKEGEDGDDDEWWEERFDAVVVASGHFNVPYIPHIEGLAELEQAHPGTVKHSKMFRGREAYRGKKIVIVGASVSGADIAYDLTTTAQFPIYAVTLGHKANGYFGDAAFHHPSIVQKPSISNITSSPTQRGGTVHFIDGTSVPNVDHLIFGTGYSWSLPFLPSVKVRNNRVPNLYQHVVYTPDPTLLFVGAVGAGLTFKIFEWQAVLAARILANRASLPSIQDMQRWEEDRIKRKGDGPGFNMVFPQFEEYFEEVRRLAGTKGPGRKLPRFERRWVEVFMQGHERRKEWWRRENERARGEIGGEGVRARL